MKMEMIMVITRSSKDEYGTGDQTIILNPQSRVSCPMTTMKTRMNMIIRMILKDEDDL